MLAMIRDWIKSSLTAWGVFVMFICFWSGLAALMLGIGFTGYRAWWCANSIEADGIVAALVQRVDTEDGVTATSYAPEFRFQAKDGSEHRVQSDTYSNPSVYAVGDRVRILYRPEKPASARIKSFLQLWLLPLVFGILGVLFSLAASAIRRVWFGYWFYWSKPLSIAA
ncbi:DUF3592 domain-containing protein [Silvibacterium sp.]|uniref:DUF3592 domain-containing protein n=1 Tax=Silvibacterium sp. TaxID=1964179 RepID=UPI0039E5F34D